MMKKILVLLHYGLKLFFRRFKTNLLLVIELVISIVAINLSICTIQNQYADLEIIQSFENDTVFVMPTKDLVNTKPGDYLELGEIQGKFTVGEQYNSSIIAPFGHNSLIMYNNEIVKQLSIPLSKGTWQSPVIIKDGANYYPVIVSNESAIKYGEAFEATTDTTSIFCYVAGVLGNHQRYLKLSATSNIASTQQLVGNCKEELMMFCNTEYFPLDLFSYKLECNSKIFFFENISDDEMKSNISVFRNQAFVFLREDIIANSIEAIRTNAIYYIPFLISALLVSIMGLLSSSLFSILKNEDFYKTSMLCGAKRGDCIAIGIANYIWTLIISIVSLVTICAIAYLNGFMLKESITLSLWNLLITALVYIFILLCGNLIPILSLSKKHQSNYYISLRGI